MQSVLLVNGCQLITPVMHLLKLLKPFVENSFFPRFALTISSQYVTQTVSGCTHIAQRRATVVPNLSKRKPLASVRKLFIKEAMVKTRENCSSCPLQSVEEEEERIFNDTLLY